VSKWAVEFDDDDGMWLRTSPTTRALSATGYVVGAFRDEKTGVRTYTLHRKEADVGFALCHYPIVFETESLDQLNGYINLLLPPKD
jgi:hypothetical protein